MIALSQEEDLKFLSAVETSAGQKFKEFYKSDPSHPIHKVELGSHTLDHSVLLEAHHNETLWVAKKDNKSIGFLAAIDLDGLLHIEELSVMFDHQGQGIGKSLLTRALEQAKMKKYSAVTLTTTDESIPWNEPFYQKVGFQRLSLEECGENLRKILKKEKENYDDPSQRIAMIFKI